MQALEFEAIAHEHTIRIPDTVPDGVKLRVQLSLEASPTPLPDADGLKALLASLAEGLTDEDLARPLDLGRELPKWDT